MRSKCTYNTQFFINNYMLEFRSAQNTYTGVAINPNL